jgi:hypothetical protein
MIGKFQDLTPDFERVFVAEVDRWYRTIGIVRPNKKSFGLILSNDDRLAAQALAATDVIDSCMAIDNMGDRFVSHFSDRFGDVLSIGCRRIDHDHPVS